MVHPGMKKSAGKAGFFSRPVHSFCYSDHFPGAGGVYNPQTTQLNYSEKKTDYRKTGRSASKQVGKFSH